MARQCPDCNDALTTEEILGIELDICPVCAGVYFDDGEMLKLKELGDDAMKEVDQEHLPTAEVEPTKEGASKMCPGCGSGMEEFAYLYTSAVKLDACPKCYGTWVQNGELEAMEHALREAREANENPQMMRTVMHQIKVVELEEKAREGAERHVRLQRFLRVLSMRRPYSTR